MKIKVGINGFGRIGRLVFRAGLQSGDVDFVGINDVLPPDYMAYLLKYDTIHGQCPIDVRSNAEGLIIDGRLIPASREREPEKLQWGRLNAEYVVEATGLFTTRERAEAHLRAGAERVVVSAPSQDMPMFVMGVNNRDYTPDMRLVSNASCTTNCLAPLAKVINDEFGIESGLMTTVHAATSSQRTVDGCSLKDWRGGRSALANIIPATTGAAKAVGRVIPELAGRLTGMAFRVPVTDVSVVDLTVNLKRPASDYGELSAAVYKASEGSMRGIIGFTGEPVVSSDITHDPRSCVFDAAAGMLMGGGFAKLIAWYDNEWSYSCRVLDLIRYMDSRK